MNENSIHFTEFRSVTRRRALAGISAALVGVALSAKTLGQTAEQSAEAPAKPENAMRTSIHQEVDFKAPPEAIYGALLDSKKFAAFSGLPATIDPTEGGAFSLFGGLIVGRNIELVANQRVVQAWRPSHWNPGVYSVTLFALEAKGSGATIVFDHTGFPEGDYDSLLSGWNSHYWGRLSHYLT